MDCFPATAWGGFPASSVGRAPRWPWSRLPPLPWGLNPRAGSGLRALPDLLCLSPNAGSRIFRVLLILQQPVPCYSGPILYFIYLFF